MYQSEMTQIMIAGADMIAVITRLPGVEYAIFVDCGHQIAYSQLVPAFPPQTTP